MFAEIHALLTEWFPGHAGKFIINPQNVGLDELLTENFVLDFHHPVPLEQSLFAAKEKMDGADSNKQKYVSDDITEFLTLPSAVSLLATMRLQKTTDVIKYFFGDKGESITQEQLGYIKDIKIIIKGVEWPANSTASQNSSSIQMSLTELYLFVRFSLFFHKKEVSDNLSGTWNHGQYLTNQCILYFTEKTHSIEIILPQMLQNMALADSLETRAIQEILQSFTFSKLFPSYITPALYSNPRFCKKVTNAVHSAMPLYRQHLESFAGLTSVVDHDWNSAVMIINTKLSTNIAYQDGILSFPDSEKNAMTYALFSFLRLYLKQNLVDCKSQLQTQSAQTIHTAEHAKIDPFSWLSALALMDRWYEEKAGLSLLGPLLLSSIQEQALPRTERTLPCDNLTLIACNNVAEFLSNNTKVAASMQRYQQQESGISLATAPVDIKTMETSELITRAYKDKVPFYLRKTVTTPAQNVPSSGLEDNVVDELHSYNGKLLHPLTYINPEIYISRTGSGFLFFGDVQPVIFYKKPSLIDWANQRNSEETFESIRAKLSWGGKPKKTLAEFVTKMEEMTYRLKGMIPAVHTKQLIATFLEACLERSSFSKQKKVVFNENMIKFFSVHLYTMGIKQKGNFYNQTLRQFIQLLRAHEGQTYQSFLSTLSSNSRISFHQNNATQVQANEVLAKPVTRFSSGQQDQELSEVEQELRARSLGNIIGVHLDTSSLTSIHKAWAYFYHLMNDGGLSHWPHVPNFILYSIKTTQIHAIEPKDSIAFYRLSGQISLFNDLLTKKPVEAKSQSSVLAPAPKTQAPLLAENTAAPMTAYNFVLPMRAPSVELRKRAFAEDLVYLENYRRARRDKILHLNQVLRSCSSMYFLNMLSARSFIGLNSFEHSYDFLVEKLIESQSTSEFSFCLNQELELLLALLKAPYLVENDGTIGLAILAVLTLFPVKVRLGVPESSVSLKNICEQIRGNLHKHFVSSDFGVLIMSILNSIIIEAERRNMNGSVSAEGLDDLIIFSVFKKWKNNWKSTVLLKNHYFPMLWRTLTQVPATHFAHTLASEFHDYRVNFPMNKELLSIYMEQLMRVLTDKPWYVAVQGNERSKGILESIALSLLNLWETQLNAEGSLLVAKRVNAEKQDKKIMLASLTVQFNELYIKLPEDDVLKKLMQEKYSKCIAIIERLGLTAALNVLHEAKGLVKDIRREKTAPVSALLNIEAQDKGKKAANSTSEEERAAKRVHLGLFAAPPENQASSSRGADATRDAISQNPSV